jgi:hypothetical protein
MKEGDTILIMPSCALEEMHMEQLVGTRTTITNVVTNNDTIRGCWVRLPRPFLNEEEWYIPYISMG